MQTIIVTVNQQGEKTALQIEIYCHINKHRRTLRFRPTFTLRCPASNTAGGIVEKGY